MNQTAAVATQNGFPLRDGTLRRLTVHTDSVRADLVLPDSVPLELLLPTIVDIVSGKRGYQPGVVAFRYRLSIPGNVELDYSKTLAQLRIRDGTTLLLTRSSAKLAAPRLDDAAEAISASIAGAEQSWSPPLSRFIAVLAACAFVVVSARTLLQNALVHQGFRTQSVALAATTSIVGLLGACAAYRVFRDESAGLTLSLVSCGFAAVAGALVVPGGLTASNALCALAASTASAGVVRAIGCHTVALTALMCFTAASSVAALVAVVAPIPLRALGAASAAISLMLIEAAGPLSVRLARLSPQQDADHVGAKAISARNWLNSMFIAFSATAALGAIGATVGQRLPGISFAALTGGVLLSRARAYSDAAASLPLVVCAAVAISAAILSAGVAYPAQSTVVAATSIGLAAAALRLGFGTPVKELSPIGQRGMELLEYLALAAVPPLACWIAGLYAAARGLDLPWS